MRVFRPSRQASCKQELLHCCKTLTWQLSSVMYTRRPTWHGSIHLMGMRSCMSSTNVQCVTWITWLGKSMPALSLSTVVLRHGRASLSTARFPGYPCCNYTCNALFRQVFCVYAWIARKRSYIAPQPSGLRHSAPAHRDHWLLWRCRYVREVFPHVTLQPSDGHFPILPLFRISGCGARSTLIIPLASSVAGNAHLALTALSKGATAAVSPLQVKLLRHLVDNVIASNDSVTNRTASLVLPTSQAVDTPAQPVCDFGCWSAVAYVLESSTACSRA